MKIILYFIFEKILIRVYFIFNIDIIVLKLYFCVFIK